MQHANMYGVHNDHSKWLEVLSSPFIAGPFPDEYVKVQHCWNDCLYSVESQHYCVPHLLTWGEDNVRHTGVPMRPQFVLNMIQPYLDNMTDVERSMLDHQLIYLLSFGEVYQVQGDRSWVNLHVRINGVGRTLLINVMNLMELHCVEKQELAPYLVRDTLN